MRKIFRDDMAVVFKQSMNFNISDKFIDALDSVLTSTFEKELGAIQQREILGRLDPGSYMADTGKNRYIVICGCDIKFLRQKFQICWQVKSGKLFTLESDDFEQEDLDFEISGINWQRVKKAWNRVFLADVLLKENKNRVIPQFFSYGYAKLFLSYYDIELTDAFINCANIQLTKLLESSTGLEVRSHDIWLEFSSEIKLDYQYKKNSYLSGGKIFFKHGQYPVKILWQSKSGLIYKLADENIDCNDIEFSFENLDAEMCRSYVYPEWSLIRPAMVEDTIRSFMNEGTTVSKSFLACADKQLYPLFENKTGIKIDQHILLLSGGRVNPYSFENGISKLKTSLFVNHNWNNITIAWQSKSGKLYKPDAENIDCNDIEFCFEGFDTALYYIQYYPKIKEPLKLKNLGFELSVLRISLNSTFTLHLKKEQSDAKQNIIESINSFINDYNKKSEKKNRQHGVVHNCYFTIDNNNIFCSIDLGSTGMHFIKQLLRYLSKLNSFQKVEIG
ncbi:MAG: hypothetical protein HYX40_09535 [Sphingobacteriales bacterium]|nr:hypothetical protein [Sphingobacteriales bacterium]